MVADVYARHGRLDGVVHGAGVIEDRYLRDKTAESFDRVYGTKVAGARALLGAVRDDVGLRRAVRLGVRRVRQQGPGRLRGRQRHARRPGPHGRRTGGRLAGRVLGIDWGPWGGTGMVSDELAREYARRGVGLIDPADGVTALLGRAGRPPGRRRLPRRPGRGRSGRRPRRSRGPAAGDVSPREPPTRSPSSGIGCVYPGAADLDAFWRNIAGGADAITDDARPTGIVSPSCSSFGTDRGGFVTGDALWFEPGRFGIMPA